MSLNPSFGELNRIKEWLFPQLQWVAEWKYSNIFSVFRLPISFLQGHPLLTKFPHAEGHLAVFLQKRPLLTLGSTLLIERRYLFLKEPMDMLA